MNLDYVVNSCFVKDTYSLFTLEVGRCIPSEADNTEVQMDFEGWLSSGFLCFFLIYPSSTHLIWLRYSLQNYWIAFILPFPPHLTSPSVASCLTNTQKPSWGSVPLKNRLVTWFRFKIRIQQPNFYFLKPWSKLYMNYSMKVGSSIMLILDHAVVLWSQCFEY